MMRNSSGATGSAKRLYSDLRCIVTPIMPNTVPTANSELMKKYCCCCALCDSSSSVLWQCSVSTWYHGVSSCSRNDGHDKQTASSM
jgi:hypothetical protein